MISCPNVRKELIRSHYNLATPFYRLLWGRHIHHGLWEGSETPAMAQQKLTETVIREAGIAAGESVVDVGCGMGGSSIFIARNVRCDVTGVTLSPVQRTWASMSARMNGVADRTRFVCGDAEAADFQNEAFDVVWSLECTEHLFDKPAFFRRAATWLKPNGRMAICAWQAADGELNERARKSVYDVCEAFLCPSLGSREDYHGWFTDAGLKVMQYHDWTDRVTRTWEICIDRVRRTKVTYLARILDRYQVQFLEHFQTILDAYRTGAMRYGCWIAAR